MLKKRKKARWWKEAWQKRKIRSTEVINWKYCFIKRQSLSSLPYVQCGTSSVDTMLLLEAKRAYFRREKTIRYRKYLKLEVVGKYIEK